MIKRLNFPNLLLLFAFCMLAMAGCKKSQPNIILINIDDMGWRDVGFMGSEFYETPNIDKLASDGVVYERAYSTCCWTLPAHASLFTGLYPSD